MQNVHRLRHQLYHNVESLTAHLLSLPAVQQLSVDTLADLLDAGLRQPGQRNLGLMLQLFTLPVAQQLSSSMISKLLHTALVHEPAMQEDLSSDFFAFCVRYTSFGKAAICRLPAAVSLDSLD
jgi:hypothetical protein